MASFLHSFELPNVYLIQSSHDINAMKMKLAPESPAATGKPS